MYSGLDIASAIITVKSWAIPARKTSAFVVNEFLVFLPAIAILDFMWLIAFSTTTRIL